MTVPVHLELSEDLYRRLREEAERLRKEPSQVIEEILERDFPESRRETGKRVDFPLIRSNRKDKINPTREQIDEAMFG